MEFMLNVNHQNECFHSINHREVSKPYKNGVQSMRLNSIQWRVFSSGTLEGVNTPLLQLLPGLL